MAPARAGAVFLGLVLQRLRRFRIEPRRGNGSRESGGRFVMVSSLGG
jgi:hypothetical protein